MLNKARQQTLLVAMAWLACTAQAQTSANAARLESDLQREPKAVDRSAISIDQPMLADAVPQDADKQRFVLGGVAVSGAHQLDAQGLSSVWSADVGREITLARAFEIARAITLAYRERGYLLSQAFLPEQKLSTHSPVTLKIQVLEGFVGRIKITGAGASELPLQPYLAALEAERPLTQATLERVLLLINELPGLSAQAALRAGGEPNATDLELIVEQRAVGGSLAMHNRVAKSQGPTRTDASIEARGLIRPFDRHALRLVSSLNERSNLAGYTADFALGHQGLRWQLNASRSQSVSEPGLPLGVGSSSSNYGLGLSYPLLRSRATNVSARTSLSGSDSQSTSDFGRLSRERIRVLRVGATWDRADSWHGISLLDVEMGQGLGRFGASKRGEALLNGAQPVFTKWTAYLARLQDLNGWWSALMAFNGQASGQRLTASEKFGLGGENFLRAYDPSEVIGERGMAAKFELRYTSSINLIPIVGYAYVDRGQVRHDGGTGQSASEWLSAAGTGLRASGAHGLKGFIEVAKPIGKAVGSTGSSDPRLFAGLGIDL